MKLLFAIIVLMSSMVFGDDSKKDSVVKPNNGMENLDDTILFRKGDRISIIIVEDRNKTVSGYVQDSGMVRFPHIGLIKAEGLTAKTFANAAKQELEKQFFKNGTVIVALDSNCKCPRLFPADPEGHGFTIIGVAQPGRYGLDNEEKLTGAQAILRAGGPGGISRSKVVKVIRTTAEGKKTIELNLKDIMENGVLSKDILIQDGDVIIIPEKIFNF